MTLFYSLALGLAVHLFLFRVTAQPEPCGGAAFAKVGNKFYVQGGAPSGDNLLSSLWALDLSKAWTTSQPAWTSLAQGPKNAYHSAGYMADNSSFITFGRDTAADPQNIPEFWVNVYDIATNAWTFQSNPANLNDNSRRDFVAVTNPATNKAYILGGDAGPAGTIWSNMFSVYDLMSRTLTEAPTSPPGPQNISTYAAVWVPRLDAMLVIGGALRSGSPQGLYLYRPNTGVWSTQATTGSFMYARFKHCAASNADGSIVAVYGGFIGEATYGDPSVYLLDTRTWTWTATAFPGRGRGNVACTVVDDTFIVWGGFYNNPNNIVGVPQGAEVMLLFKLSTKTWTTNYTPSGSVDRGSPPDSKENTQDPSNPNTTPPPSKGLSTAVIGGIAAGACAMLLVAAFTIYVIHRRNSKKKKLKQDMMENPLSGYAHGHGHGYLPPDDSDSPVPHRPSPSVPTNKYSPTLTNKYSPGMPEHENRPSVEGYTSNVGYSDPATPPTLQFLAMGEPSGHDQYNPGRQSYMSDGSVYFPPPPNAPPPGNHNHYSQAAQVSDGRRNDPQSVVFSSSYGGDIGPPCQSQPNTDQYHDGGGYKHQSMQSVNSGYSDGTSSNPQSFGYLDPSQYAGRSQPPMPKRPVSNPQGGHGFGSVEQAAPGAPQAILQYQQSRRALADS
ncbi:hypothetical protein BG006_001857 [Podila minutissima]|uniref:Uncharacterized protein n=1 Tax=Podila minutissima TaxID=64525 RepID=A0A9P5SCD3_9FUNG|nr:hypothetical protein BG006_001857 [Podila minutissima]